MLNDYELKLQSARTFVAMPFALDRDMTLATVRKAIPGLALHRNEWVVGAEVGKPADVVALGVGADGAGRLTHVTAYFECRDMLRLPSIQSCIAAQLNLRLGTAFERSATQHWRKRTWWMSDGELTLHRIQREAGGQLITYFVLERAFRPTDEA